MSEIGKKFIKKLKNIKSLEGKKDSIDSNLELMRLKNLLEKTDKEAKKISDLGDENIIKVFKDNILHTMDDLDKLSRNNKINKTEIYIETYSMLYELNEEIRYGDKNNIFSIDFYKENLGIKEPNKIQMLISNINIPDNIDENNSLILIEQLMDLKRNKINEFGIINKGYNNGGEVFDENIFNKVFKIFIAKINLIKKNINFKGNNTLKLIWILNNIEETINNYNAGNFLSDFRFIRKVDKKSLEQNDSRSDEQELNLEEYGINGKVGKSIYFKYKKNGFLSNSYSEFLKEGFSIEIIKEMLKSINKNILLNKGYKIFDKKVVNYLHSISKSQKNSNSIVLVEQYEYIDKNDFDNLIQIINSNITIDNLYKYQIKSKYSKKGILNPDNKNIYILINEIFQNDIDDFKKYVNILGEYQLEKILELKQKNITSKELLEIKNKYNIDNMQYIVELLLEYKNKNDVIEILDNFNGKIYIDLFSLKSVKEKFLQNKNKLFSNINNIIDIFGETNYISNFDIEKLLNINISKIKEFKNIFKENNLKIEANLISKLLETNLSIEDLNFVINKKLDLYTVSFYGKEYPNIKFNKLSNFIIKNLKNDSIRRNLDFVKSHEEDLIKLIKNKKIIIEDAIEILKKGVNINSYNDFRKTKEFKNANLNVEKIEQIIKFGLKDFYLKLSKLGYKLSSFNEEKISKLNKNQRENIEKLLEGGFELFDIQAQELFNNNYLIKKLSDKEFISKFLGLKKYSNDISIILKLTFFNFSEKTIQKYGDYGIDNIKLDMILRAEIINQDDNKLNKQNFKYKNFFKKFNISFPSRYPLSVLEKMYNISEGKEILDSNKINSLIIYPKTDHNGAFESGDLEKIKELSKKSNIFIFEVESDDKLFEILNNFKNKTGYKKLNFLIIGGHGYNFGTQFSSKGGYDLSELDVNDFKDNFYFLKNKTNIINNLKGTTTMFESCSTAGGDNSIVKNFSKELKVKTFGPTLPTVGSNIKIGNEGNISVDYNFSKKYSDLNKSKTRLYKNGKLIKEKQGLDYNSSKN